MFSEINTSDTILARLLSQITNDIDQSEGSFTRTILSVVSNELEQAYQNLDDAIDVFFLTDATEDYLDDKALEFGIVRKSGVKAKGIARFSGTNGTNVPIGTLIETLSGLKYVTLKAGAISGGYVDIDIEALVEGTLYNVPSGTITVMSQQIVGVTSVTNQAPVSGGAERETDEELRARALFKAQNPITSGNANHYKAWAMEVAGIGDSKVYPVWNGAGTVKVVVISSDKTGVIGSKVTEVANYIESQRPIGATVTVVSATEKLVNVTVSIQRDSNIAQATVQSNVEGILRGYLKDIAFKKNFSSYAIMGSLLLEAEGVLDYSNLLLNGASSNVTIADTEVAVLGTVTITWL